MGNASADRRGQGRAIELHWTGVTGALRYELLAWTRTGGQQQIGGEFGPPAWAQQLADAHVDSITGFARGHRGLTSYNRLARPERRRPRLQCNPLALQIEAAHARDFHVPIYTAVLWMQVGKESSI